MPIGNRIPRVGRLRKLRPSRTAIVRHTIATRATPPGHHVRRPWVHESPDFTGPPNSPQACRTTPVSEFRGPSPAEPRRDPAGQSLLPEGSQRQLRQTRPHSEPGADLHRCSDTAGMERPVLGRKSAPGVSPGRPDPRGGRHYRPPDLRLPRLPTLPLVPQPRRDRGAGGSARYQLPRRILSARRRHSRW